MGLSAQTRILKHSLVKADEAMNQLISEYSRILSDRIKSADEEVTSSGISSLAGSLVIVVERGNRKLFPEDKDSYITMELVLEGNTYLRPRLLATEYNVKLMTGIAESIVEYFDINSVTVELLGITDIRVNEFRNHHEDAFNVELKAMIKDGYEISNISPKNIQFTVNNKVMRS